MATSQEVLQHVTGHTGGTPLQLNWQAHFTPVQHPRTPGRSAFTNATFNINLTPPTRPDPDGNFRFHNVHITVNMNRGASWVVNGQQAAALLNHEQGHYNITWLVMRELCRLLLEDQWDQAVLGATNSGAPRQVRGRFTQDFNRLSQTASAEVDRLNRLYDQQTNHGLNAPQQAQWDALFRYVIQNPDSDMTTLLMISGGTPSGF
jgi:hypothetical protein